MNSLLILGKASAPSYLQGIARKASEGVVGSYGTLNTYGNPNESQKEYRADTESELSISESIQETCRVA